MKNRFGVGWGVTLLWGLFFSSTMVAHAADFEEEVMAKLDGIAEMQQQILERIDSLEAAQKEQKDLLAEIEKKQKSYVNPKWAP